VANATISPNGHQIDIKSHGFNILFPNRFPNDYGASAENQVLIGRFLQRHHSQIVEGMPFDLAKFPRKLMLHMDNASPHHTRNARVCGEIQNPSNSPSTILPGSGSI
jgi:hypothetical protein